MPKPQRIAIIGTGYVGLTTGACFAKLGHQVICADIDPAEIKQLNAGHIPILEDGLEDLVREGVASGRLSFVLGAARAATDCDFAYMCVPTPKAADGSADLSFLMAAAAQIRGVLPAGAVVVNKSTVPVGTAAQVAEALGRPDIAVASNPEFLREGTAVHDFFHPDRIVIGAPDPATAERVAALYHGVDAPRLLVQTNTAELIKYAANAFLAAKISFANSISNLCEALGADAHEVLEGMGSDARIGRQFLKPGPGWGGSCFPKDTYALIDMAHQAGYQFELLEAVIRTNDVQMARMVETIRQRLGGQLAGARIAAWGLSFKAGTNDTRQSPALHIIRELLAAGAHVTAYDPAVTTAPDGAQLAPDALAACQDADILVVLTEWPQFATVPAAEVGARLHQPLVFDTRDILDAPAYQAAGLQLTAVGRP